MLQGEQPVDPSALEAIASQVEQDPLATETYLESQAATRDSSPAAYTQSDLRRALTLLSSEIGFIVKKEKKLDVFSISGHGFSKTRFGLGIDSLEKDPTLYPLTSSNSKLRNILKALARPGERLPLVIGSHRQGAFRASVAYWMGTGEPLAVESFDSLEQLVQNWNGRLPDPAAWHICNLKAEEEARTEVVRMVSRATAEERHAAERQIEAARIRLSRELGRYLICTGADPHDLKQALYEQTTRSSGAAGVRLKQCFAHFAGYPEWSSNFCHELERWVGTLPQFRRTSRLAGMEVDAALRDPRWIVG
jgi:hypothetical protein